MNEVTYCLCHVVANVVAKDAYLSFTLISLRLNTMRVRTSNLALVSLDVSATCHHGRRLAAASRWVASLLYLFSLFLIIFLPSSSDQTFISNPGLQQCMLGRGVMFLMLLTVVTNRYKITMFGL